MILLVTPNLRGQECAIAIKEFSGHEVVLAESLQQATSLLRANEYVGVVLDQYLTETETTQASALMEHVGTAIPIQVNLAVSGLERVVREVQAALQRRTREEMIARRAAHEHLHSELSGTVTALVLHCDLAIAMPDLPEAAREKLQGARDLVQKLRTQLHTEMDVN